MSVSAKFKTEFIFFHILLPNNFDDVMTYCITPVTNETFNFYGVVINVEKILFELFKN